MQRIILTITLILLATCMQAQTTDTTYTKNDSVTIDVVTYNSLVFHYDMQGAILEYREQEINQFYRDKYWLELTLKGSIVINIALMLILVTK